MGETNVAQVVLAVIAGCSLMYAIVNRRSQSAQEIAKDLADYKVKQADLHARTDECVLAIRADLREIKETVKRIELGAKR